MSDKKEHKFLKIGMCGLIWTNPNKEFKEF